jgi:hypothetical protein
VPYTAPTPAELKTRYAKFASVADDTVQYWLTDAERIVTTAWIEADYQPAIMAYAAHNLALEGLEAGGLAGQVPTGVTQFRSGNFSVGFSESAASAEGYASTRYGQDFKIYLRRNRGGARVVGDTTQACC